MKDLASYWDVESLETVHMSISYDECTGAFVTEPIPQQKLIRDIDFANERIRVEMYTVEDGLIETTWVSDANEYVRDERTGDMSVSDGVPFSMVVDSTIFVPSMYDYLDWEQSSDTELTATGFTSLHADGGLPHVKHGELIDVNGHIVIEDGFPVEYRVEIEYENGTLVEDVEWSVGSSRVKLPDSV